MNSFVACAMNFHFSLYPEKLQIEDSLIHYRKKNPKIKKNSIDHEFTSPKQKNNFVRIMGLGFKSQLLRWAILTPEDARLLKKL